MKDFLQNLAADLGSTPSACQDRAFILNAHALPTIVDLVEVLVAQGVEAPAIHFIGKPYSTIPAASERLLRAGIGFDSVGSRFKAGGLMDAHRALLNDIVPHIIARHPARHFTLLDSGGLLTTVYRSQRPDHPAVSIQLTSSGSRYFRPEEIIDIGQSVLKKEAEGPYIARGTLEEIRNRLGGLGGRRICIVGMGAIVHAIAAQLTAEGISFAHISGLGQDEMGIAADLVIGATGYDISPTVRRIVPKGVAADLFSASSWDIEFKALLDGAHAEVDLSDCNSCMVRAGDFVIHNGGCPINFNRRMASDAGEIAMTRGLTLAAAMYPKKFAENCGRVQTLHNQYYV